MEHVNLLKLHHLVHLYQQDIVQLVVVMLKYHMILYVVYHLND